LAAAINHNAVMRQIFLDTETTGLDPASGDRIVEIGGVEMDGRRLTGRRLHHYLNPRRPVSPEAVRIHGLDDTFLADKPAFEVVGADIVAFIKDAEVIIHNAAFDSGFLDAEFARLGWPPLREVAARVTDTLTMARRAYPGKSNSLDALCRRFEVDNSRRDLHGALLDAGLLAEVYVRMTRGQETLAMDVDGQAEQSGETLTTVDLRAWTLPVIEPSVPEWEAHLSWLDELDKVSGGRRVWARPQPMA
jgi:DNA polymerase III subunit epsilon